MSDTILESDIRLGDRPLVVSDIDEVVLEFLSPFQAYLESCDHVLLPRSFRLTGNVVHRETQEAASETAVNELLETFYATQDRWQTPTLGVVETLRGLSRHADIVFLTAMPPRHATVRRALLDRLGLPYPLLASEDPKGPIVQRLHAGRALPVVFIDDIARNLESVQTHAPSCLLINLMANKAFRALAPAPADCVHVAADWTDAANAIRAHFQR